MRTVARTPSKLTDLLQSRGFAESDLSNLHITKGNVTDTSAVRTTLTHPTQSNAPVSLVLSGIGGTPKPQLSLIRPFTIDQPNICQDATRTILDVLRSFPADAPRPFFVAVSTTGISQLQRDVPLLFFPLYRWFLHAPHQDKVVMERLLDETLRSPSGGAKAPLSGFVSVRASLLLDGARKPVKEIREGWERSPSNDALKGKAPGPAVGYTISRASVGAWIFERVLANQGRESEWSGKMATITH